MRGFQVRSQCVYKSFSSDFMKNRVTKDLKLAEKKAYEKLKTTLKKACVPLKSK